MPIAKYTPPTQSLWVWGQHLPPISEAASRELTLELRLALRDHYGHVIDGSELPDLRADDMYAAPGHCTLEMLRAGTCVQNFNNSNALTFSVSTTFAPEVSGIVALRVVSFSSDPRNNSMKLVLGVKRFCLHCTFEVRAYVAGLASTTLRAEVAVSLLLPTFAPQRVYFQQGTSPLRGTDAAWKTWSPRTPVTSPVTLVNISCLAANLSSCQAPE